MKKFSIKFAMGFLIWSVAAHSAKAQRIEIDQPFYGTWVSWNKSLMIKMELIIKRGREGLDVEEKTFDAKNGKRTSRNLRYRILNDSCLEVAYNHSTPSKMKYRFSVDRNHLRFLSPDSALHESIPIIFIFEFRRLNNVVLVTH